MPDHPPTARYRATPVADRVPPIPFLLVPAALLAISLLAGCAGSGSATTSGWTGERAAPAGQPAEAAPELDFAALGDEAPRAAREFRGAWIATVDNIDWPSRPGLTPEEQRSEMRRLLDQAAALHLNAVVFQVRPTADAMYQSALEPSSYYLTGRQGTDLTYDPLTFAVEEAHRRGIELHAWFNPFRASHPTMDSLYDANHVSVRHPDWVVSYGDYLWLDPGNREASEHSLAVIEDVVRRYDIDGVHLDDYFYPYPVSGADGREVPFPDSASHAIAVGAGGTLAIDDWRRENVNAFIRAMYERVKRVKPWVKVGISPFGIWRPGHPEGVTGFDPYDRLYADARLWLTEGWVDYFTPQLYWPVDSPGQPYDRLLDWWIEQNARDRHLWPGNFTSRVILDGARHWEPDEIVRQVAVTRGRGGAAGNVHFSMKALMPGGRIDSVLAVGAYRAPALVPATTWLGGSVPGTPEVTARRLGDSVWVTLAPGDGDPPFAWHVRTRHRDGWRIEIVPAWRRMLVFEHDRPDLVVVSSVNRLGQEGPERRVEI